jgi:hypothetical protein
MGEVLGLGLTHYPPEAHGSRGSRAGETPLGAEGRYSGDSGWSSSRSMV